MSALGSTDVNCPVCGQALNVPLTFKAGERDDDNCLHVTITPDVSEIWAHAETHRDEADQ